MHRGDNEDYDVNNNSNNPLYLLVQSIRQSAVAADSRPGVLKCVARNTAIIDAAKHSKHSPYQYLRQYCPLTPTAQQFPSYRSPHSPLTPYHSFPKYLSSQTQQLLSVSHSATPCSEIFPSFRQFHKAQFATLCTPHHFTPSISKSQYFLELISHPPPSSDKCFGLVNKPRRRRRRIIEQGRSGSCVISSPSSMGILRMSPVRLMP